MPWAIGGHQYPYKPADESITESTVLQDDDHLKFDVLSGEVWVWNIHGGIDVESATPDLQMAMNGPAFSHLCMDMHVHEHVAIVGDPEDLKDAWNDPLDVNYSAGGVDVFDLFGCATFTADGTVVFRWGPINNSVDYVKIRQGSRILAVRVA